MILSNSIVERLSPKTRWKIFYRSVRIYKGYKTKNKCTEPKAQRWMVLANRIYLQTH